MKDTLGRDKDDEQGKLYRYELGWSFEDDQFEDHERLQDGTSMDVIATDEDEARDFAQGPASWGAPSTSEDNIHDLRFDVEFIARADYVVLVKEDLFSDWEVAETGFKTREDAKDAADRIEDDVYKSRATQRIDRGRRAYEDDHHCFACGKGFDTVHGLEVHVGMKHDGTILKTGGA